MSEEISLDIAMSKEEMNKIKDLLTSTPGLRHYNKVCHYDFCKRCYAKFNNWINKHKED